MAGAPIWAEPRPTARIREVYFVRAKKLKLIKIGVSDNTRARFANLQQGCPDELELLGVLYCDRYGVLERELHKRFAKQRVRGEWFKPSKRLLDLIATATWPEPEKRHRANVAAAFADTQAELDRLGREQVAEEMFQEVIAARKTA